MAKKKKKSRQGNYLPLVICAALFLAALLIYVFSGDASRQAGDPAVEGGVRITEIMADNRTYPDSAGRAADYIELTNLTANAVDISNYKLSDDKSTIGYTFPQGTVLPPYGAIVCWCASKGGEGYAAFGISNDGDETIYLYNSVNVIIDQKTVPPLEENQPCLRNPDGSWTVGGLASPGYANTEEGHAQWLAAIDRKPLKVVISEAQTTARYTWVDAAGTVCDWVELHNQATEPAILDGCYLSDDPENPLKWQIFGLTLEPGGYALIRCGDKTGAGASFSLSSDGTQILLSSPYGDPISTLDCPAMERDTTWMLGADGTYALSSQPTPGFANTEEGYAQWLLSVGLENCPVIISEVQPANRSGVPDAAGGLSDWIELYNPGGEAVDLSGFFLSDEEADPFKWKIDALTLQPGEYRVISCTGKKGNPAEASFALSRNGCTVLLSGPVGNRVAQVACPAVKEDYAWQWVSDYTYVETELISPGFENTPAGHEAFRASQKILGSLAVWEVMASNDRYMMQADGEYYDWIELKNVSDAVIDLSDYALSDSATDLQLFRLPQRELAPGEVVVVICSGNTELTGKYIQAPFTLNREMCWVYVARTDGTLSDYARISGVPLMGSAGRMAGETGLYYFGTPTPGEENKDGAAEVTADPFFETPDGIYNDVDQVSVVLSGEGPIYYTLDGREPTMYSAQYTGPLVLTQTTVIRAKCYAEGKLPSNVITASYIINENHTLPVISLAVNPVSMFGPSGVYTKYEWDREIPCNVTLFEGDGGFSIDCGIEMYGHSNLVHPKKSFKITFRSLYGSSTLNYPVYGEDGPQVYDALCIRAGQDYPQSIFRDELFTSLCRDMTDKVLAQRDKFCILYINGEYYGIYCMKEAFGQMFYAQNRDVRKESVEIVQAPVEYDTEMHEFFRFLRASDMTQEENYAYACTVFDMDSVIDWMIIEGYSTNGDVQQNLRYFRSSDDGYRYQMAFYDLDWAFYYHRPFGDVLDNDRDNWQHLMLTQSLMKNPEFRQKFLERLSYHMQNTLSPENVVARINYYHDLLEPEVPRERERWNGTVAEWEWYMDKLRNFVTEFDHMGDIVDRLKRYIGLTQEEIDTYFWRWS